MEETQAVPGVMLVWGVTKCYCLLMLTSRTTIMFNLLGDNITMFPYSWLFPSSSSIHIISALLLITVCFSGNVWFVFNNKRWLRSLYGSGSEERQNFESIERHQSCGYRNLIQAPKHFFSPNRAYWFCDTSIDVPPLLKSVCVCLPGKEETARAQTGGSTRSHVHMMRTCTRMSLSHIYQRATYRPKIDEECVLCAVFMSVNMCFICSPLEKHLFCHSVLNYVWSLS